MGLRIIEKMYGYFSYIIEKMTLALINMGRSNIRSTRPTPTLSSTLSPTPTPAAVATMPQQYTQEEYDAMRKHAFALLAECQALAARSKEMDIVLAMWDARREEQRKEAEKDGY